MPHPQTLALFLSLLGPADVMVVSWRVSRGVDDVRDCARTISTRRHLARRDALAGVFFVCERVRDGERESERERASEREREREREFWISGFGFRETPEQGERERACP